MLRRALVALFVALLLAASTFRSAGASTPPPTPPPSTPTPEPPQGSSTSGGVGRWAARAATYVLDPSQALKDLVLDLAGIMLRDFNAYGARATDDAWRFFVASQTTGKAGTSKDGASHPLQRMRTGLYETVGRALRPVAGALFVPFAVLRLVWYHKRHLTGEGDSIYEVVAEWVGVGLLVALLPRVMDWTWDFSLHLSRLVLSMAGPRALQGSPGDLLARLILGSSGLAQPFFLFIVTLLAMGVVYGIVSTYFAVQAASFLFAALAPLLLAFSLLPPFRFVRRMIAMAYLLLLIAPSIAALVLLVTTWLPLEIAPHPSLFGIVTRIVWLATAMGLLLKVAGTLSSVGLDAAKGFVSATVRGIASVASVLAGGAALGGAVAIGGLQASSSASAAGSAAAGATTASTAASGNTAGNAAGGATTPTAARYTRAARAADIAAFVGGGGRIGMAGRMLGRYYRSLADRADRGRVDGPHSVGFGVARRLGMPGGYASYVQTLSTIQDMLSETDDGFAARPLLWSQYNDEKAELAGALATLYREDPRKFRSVLKQNGWQGLKALAMERLGKNQGGGTGET